MLITQAADFAWHNKLCVIQKIYWHLSYKLINTYLQVSHLSASDLALSKRNGVDSTWKFTYTFIASFRINSISHGLKFRFSDLWCHGKQNGMLVFIVLISNPPNGTYFSEEAPKNKKIFVLCLH